MGCSLPTGFMGRSVSRGSGPFDAQREPDLHPIAHVTPPSAVVMLANAVGPVVQLRMDAHGALTLDRVRLRQAASEYELTWFEEVLAGNDPPGLAEVRRRVPMPVATGETETTRLAFRGRGGSAFESI